MLHTTQPHIPIWIASFPRILGFSAFCGEELEPHLICLRRHWSIQRYVSFLVSCGITRGEGCLLLAVPDGLPTREDLIPRRDIIATQLVILYEIFIRT